MSSPFLSAFTCSFLYYCILRSAIRPIPSSNTRLSQCPLCNGGFNPFPLILLQSFKRFQAEQQRHREEEEETFPSKRKKINCGVVQRIELKTNVKRSAHRASGLSIRSFLQANISQAFGHKAILSAAGKILLIHFVLTHHFGKCNNNSDFCKSSHFQSTFSQVGLTVMLLQTIQAIDNQG